MRVAFCTLAINEQSWLIFEYFMYPHVFEDTTYNQAGYKNMQTRKTLPMNV